MNYKTIQVNNREELNYNIVMEKKLGRPVKKSEVVHHINNDKMNDTPKNLYLCECVGIHRSVHNQLYKLIKNLSLELLKNDLIQFNEKTGIYYITNQLIVNIMNINLKRVNLSIEDINTIGNKRKIILNKSNKPKIDIWKTTEGKALYHKLQELDKRN